ncbi:MAG TPA: glycine cleavage system protein GcvH [Phycisphaeraceae bacterium]
MTTPSDRRYSPTHEWHKLEDGLVVIGISQFAVDELTDITFLEIRVTQGPIQKGQTIGEIESVKAVSDLYCGIDGEVVAVNQEAIDNPALINEDPYTKGWIIKVKPSDPSQLDQLLSAEEYESKYAG